MEHQADVHPQPCPMSPARLNAVKKSGRRAIEAAQRGRDAINCYSDSADGKIALGLQSQTSVRQAARESLHLDRDVPVFRGPVTKLADLIRSPALHPACVCQCTR